MTPRFGQPEQQRARGFTLLEILIAVGILGLALIGVAAVFPVGATWTRQTIEATVAQNVAMNAVDIVKTSLTPFALDWNAGATYPNTAVVLYNGQFYTTNGVPTAGQAPTTVAGWTPIAYAPVNKFYTQANGTFVLDASSRTYGFGQATPWPPTTPATAEYSWAGLLRSVGTNQFALTVFVFRRGDTNAVSGQFFTSGGEMAPSARNGETYIGQLNISTYTPGTLNPSTETVTGAVPPLGSWGMQWGTNGVGAGTVFKVVPNPTGPAAPAPNGLGPTKTVPPIIDSDGNNTLMNENIIWAPPPTNWPNSPLIYVYQTTISY